MQKVTKVLSWIINIVFYPLLIVALVVAILFACGIKPYITMSGSMEPEIKTGSICFVNTKADYAEMVTGDIIAFEVETGGLVTHRVISVNPEGLETKGDNNEHSDGITTTSGNFRGKTLFSVPYVGYALKALQQPKNFMIVIIVIAGIFLFNVMDSMFTKKEQKEAAQAAEGQAESSGSADGRKEEAKSAKNPNGGKWLKKGKFQA